MILGAGLASGFLAKRISKLHPEIEFAVIEQASQSGSNRTWSFHKTDVSESNWQWLSQFVSQNWKSYSIRFPNVERTLSSAYSTISGHKFNDVLKAELSDKVFFNCSVRDIQKNIVTLEDGFKIEAPIIFDGRGWPQNSPQTASYQKFVGIEIETLEPHGLEHPVLMDAQIPQTDGFRFFYLLPYTPTTLLIEDTYYSSSSRLPIAQIKSEIEKYLLKKEWTIKQILREETGVLPIPMTLPEPKISNTINIGMRAGLFHPTTGYSLPWAVEFADLASQRIKTLSPQDLKLWAFDYTHAHWKKQHYYFMLNRMLFLAAKPEERYKVLEKFYQQSDSLISRFYAGKTSFFDKVKIFTGRPPVPVHRAIATLRRAPPVSTSVSANI